MKVKVELGNEEVREMLKERLRELMPDIIIDDKEISIKVMSKQNFKVHDWEDGQIKVEYENHD